MTKLSLTALITYSVMTFIYCQDTWHPTALDRCRTNEDCQSEDQCCTYQPAMVGRRDLQERALTPDGMFHYCGHWRNETSQYCSVHFKYSPDATHYFGICPCRPGLTCIPSGHTSSGYVTGKCKLVE